MDSENEKPRKAFKVLNYYQKKIILAEIQEGKRHPEEILKEHGVGSVISHVLKRWPEQIKRNEKSPFIIRKKRYDLDFRRNIVRQIEFGQITINEAVEKYNVPRESIYSWRKKYSSDITPVIQIKSMSESETKDLTETQRQNKELEKALEQAKLKILGLETMIDVAEQELKIEIRKKSGSKQ